MSNIRFNTHTQTDQLRAIAALHPAPPVTERNIRRLRSLTQNPKIRASVASRSHCLSHGFSDLAHDSSARARA